MKKVKVGFNGASYWITWPGETEEVGPYYIMGKDVLVDSGERQHPLPDQQGAGAKAIREAHRIGLRPQTHIEVEV